MNLPTTHYFVPVDGVIKWIKEMPKKPSTPIDYYYHNLHTAGGEDVKEEWEKYQTALQSAIDNAIKVENHEITKAMLRVNGNNKGNPLEDRKVYSLECSVQKKISPCGSKYTVALVTFDQASEPNLEDEDDDETKQIWESLRKSAPRLTKKIKQLWSEPGDSEKGEEEWLTDSVRHHNPEVDCWRDVYFNFKDGEGWIAFHERMSKHFTIARKREVK